MITLAYGEIHLGKDHGKDVVPVIGGFPEVRPNLATVLADTAERGDEIDVARAQAARERAERSFAERTGREAHPLFIWPR